MIYSVKAFLMVLLMVSAAAVMRFPLQKISDAEFVGQIKARAARGQK